MALQEAEAYLGNDLVLPIAGKKYRVVEYAAEVGLRVEVLLNAQRGFVSDRSRQILDDEAERDLYRDVLGSTYDDLFAVVSWPMLRLCAVTAMTHFNISPEEGERVWKANISPQEAAAGKASSRSSRPATRGTTAAASTTRKPASGSGTRSRRSS